MKIIHPILQEPESYMPLNEAELNTVEALCQISGMFVSKNHIQSIAATQPVCLGTQALTVSRLIGAYKWATSPDAVNSDFELTADILEKRVNDIDQHGPISLGYYYPSKLTQECQIIIPTAISLSTPMENLCRPICTWVENRWNMQCQIIGSVLFIFLIRRICMGHPVFFNNDVDWSQLISSALSPQSILQVPAVLNQEGLAVKSQLTIKDSVQYRLEETKQQMEKNDE